MNNMGKLHNVCESGDIETVKSLIFDGNINEKNNIEYTPLHYACFYGHCEIAELLIRHGANINEKNICGNTPLHFACRNRYYGIAHLLISHGANINDKNFYEHTQLEEECNVGNFHMAKFLLANNANISITKNKETLIMIARKHGHTNVTELLEKEIKKRIYILSLILQHDVLKHHVIRKFNLL